MLNEVQLGFLKKSRPQKSKLNCGFLSELPELIINVIDGINKAGYNYSATFNESTGKYDLSSPDSDLTFNIIVDADWDDMGSMYDGNLPDLHYIDYTDSDGMTNWACRQLACSKKLNSSLQTHYYSKIKNLNSDMLSPKDINRIKAVFKAAQEGSTIESKKAENFRWTAFRTNKSEGYVISTLQFFSKKRNKEWWIQKSSLSCDFSEEGDTWTFEPNHDVEKASHQTDKVGGTATRAVNRAMNNKTNMRVALQERTFTEKDPEKSDRQASYWLVGIIQEMIDDIIANPPNRIYDFFVEEGLISKKNIKEWSRQAAIESARKGIVTGIEVLKAFPDTFGILLRDGNITGEQVYKVLPEKLDWLVTHNYMPFERALRLDPEIENRLYKKGFMKTDVSDLEGKSVGEIVALVRDGTITAKKAFSANDKTLQKMVEEKLIEPTEAYRLEPSILNWMLKNHHIGRAEATRLKPKIKDEMRKQKVDWDSLDASSRINSSRRSTWSKPWASPLTSINSAHKPISPKPQRRVNSTRDGWEDLEEQDNPKWEDVDEKTEVNASKPEYNYDLDAETFDDRDEFDIMNEDVLYEYQRNADLVIGDLEEQIRTGVASWLVTRGFDPATVKHRFHVTAKLSDEDDFQSFVVGVRVDKSIALTPEALTTLASHCNDIMERFSHTEDYPSGTPRKLQEQLEKAKFTPLVGDANCISVVLEFM